MKVKANMHCPCGSGQKYKKCCQIFHKGAWPKNALLLMKSRYCAFVASEYKYIIKTTHQENSDFTSDTASWKTSILQFTQNSDFLNLEILAFEEQDEVAFVTFKANILQNNHDVSFTEKSQFFKVEGKWLYHSGVFLDE